MEYNENEQRQGDGHSPERNGSGQLTPMRGFSQDNGTSTPLSRPDMLHASSSASYSTSASQQMAGLSLQSSSASNHMTQPYDQRPSLSDARRVSSGIGGSSFGQGSYRDKEDAVPVGFDEGILRGLCDMDGSMNLLVDRIKQGIASCKQVAVFFRSRADIEEKYARSITELVRTTSDVYGRADCKAGTFVASYQQSLKVQEQLSQNRIRFATRLNEMCDEMLGLAREGERQRKMHKENGQRYQATLQESDAIMEKCKARFDAAAEELERLLVSKEGESFKDAGMRNAVNNGPNGPGSSGGGKRALGKAMKTGGMLFKGKGAGSIQKQEDDIRSRLGTANDAFRKSVQDYQTLRQEYFNFQLPKILRLLKEVADEIDLGTQYHLTRFAFLYESTVVNDGTTLNPMGAPDEGPGLKAIFEAIDNRTDFKSYMQNYAVARGSLKGPRRDGPYDEGFLPPLPPHVQKSLDHSDSQSIKSGSTELTTPQQSSAYGQPSSNPSHPETPDTTYAVLGIPASTGHTFGVDLGAQLERDKVEVPKVLEKCAEAIEMFGLENTGIYRLSGTTSRVQALKHALDSNVEAVDVQSPEWSSDINVVSGALKLWFRELPEPVLTFGLYDAFIEAARYDNDRLRYIRLHGQVNNLPDPNYATLKYFMGHLNKIQLESAQNSMSISNLSIVFGPTLLGAPPEMGGLNLEHMSFQCKAIETILKYYDEIFVDEDDGSGEHEEEDAAKQWDDAVGLGSHSPQTDSAPRSGGPQPTAQMSAS